MQRDANMLVPDAQQPPSDQDNDRGDNRDPCPEDEEYFDRPDATFAYIPSTYYFVPRMYPVHPIIDGAFHRWTAAELKKVLD